MLIIIYNTQNAEFNSEFGVVFLYFYLLLLTAIENPAYNMFRVSDSLKTFALFIRSLQSLENLVS